MFVQLIAQVIFSVAAVSVNGAVGLASVETVIDRGRWRLTLAPQMVGSFGVNTGLSANILGPAAPFGAFYLHLEPDPNDITAMELVAIDSTTGLETPLPAPSPGDPQPLIAFSAWTHGPTG
jgi:hypothetical protein